MNEQMELFPRWNPHLSNYKKRIGRRWVKRAKALLPTAKGASLKYWPQED